MSLRIIAVILILALSAARARAQGPSFETGLSPAFPAITAPGVDFAATGVSTRVVGLNAPQAEPFVLMGPVLPRGCSETLTLVQWTFLHNFGSPAAHTITFNGVPVVGTKTGFGQPDLCWIALGSGTSYTAVLPAGLTVFGGPNTVAGATDGMLGPLGTTSRGEGFDILTVYECPGEPLRVVEVYTGYTSTTSGTAPVALPFTHPFLGCGLHFFTNAMDGQSGPDSFFVNGVDVSGLIPGTTGPGNAWAGLLGAWPVPPTNWLHDHADGDVSTWVLAGSLSMTMGSVDGGDCVGHSLAAVSYALLSADNGALYCTAKTNSCGTLPVIGSSGVASVTSPNGYIVDLRNARASNAGGLKQGVLIYSVDGPGNVPFAGGTLCLSPAGPIKSTVVLPPASPGTAGQCDAAHAIDMNAFAQGLIPGQTVPDPALSTPCTQVWCQWIARDTLAAGPLVSDGLTYVQGP
jgi:hypothetical protein